ncbi:helix-turn-helix transcriptional regulator [Bacillus cytotoxicus]|uniref:helix-turn-helix transcriptional regulator n=1 Tax=Bacillus cytotoxicus TaxID=580165 RepID=UPI00244C602F|nr:AraC family transcriptional regulator [Bacillus cytotoxicus]MDH2880913.1 AraC family transcriptional regulator [Bacillus cytotoxicus]
MQICKEIVAERRTYREIEHTHAHSHAQLILPLQGELSIKAGLQNLLIDQKTLFFVPPECTHTFHSAVRNEFLVLDIPHFMIPEGNMQRTGISHVFDKQWKSIRYLILHEIEQGHTSLNELYPYISRCLFKERHPKSIQYIHEHYDKNITVQQLAALEHYNRSYYSEWFLKETGKSPSVYIQEVRLNKAKELLRNTNLSIMHIAIQVGLEHQSSLTRLFQKYEGMSPSQYRKGDRDDVTNI